MISYFNCIAKFCFKYLDLQDFFLSFFFLERSVVKIRKGAKKDGKFGWLSKRLDKSIKLLSSEAFEPTKIAPVTTLLLEHRTARDPIGENRRTFYLWWSDNTCEQTKKKDRIAKSATSCFRSSLEAFMRFEEYAIHANIQDR